MKQIKLQEPVCARETRGNGIDEGCGWAWHEGMDGGPIKGSHPVSDSLTGPGHCCHINRICGVVTGLGLLWFTACSVWRTDCSFL